MRDRPALLLPVGVEIGDVAHLVPVLHLSREEAVVAAKRDVLARLVRRERRAVARHHAKQREAWREPVPLDDATAFDFRHASSTAQGTSERKRNTAKSTRWTAPC